MEEASAAAAAAEETATGDGEKGNRVVVGNERLGGGGREGEKGVGDLGAGVGVGVGEGEGVGEATSSSSSPRWLRRGLAFAPIQRGAEGGGKELR